MNKQVISLELEEGYADKLKKTLKTKEYDAIRDRIDISIMKNVQQMPGNNIIEKIDNYNAYTENNLNNKVEKEIIRYKIKHRGLYYGKI